MCPFYDCIGEINNRKVGNAKGIDVVKPVHSLIEYNDHYSKTSEGLWKYYKDKLQSWS